MKRCPTCQRTFADDNLTFCLDDGAPLARVESGPFDAPPTVRIPDPRLTDQPLPPPLSPPPTYGQASPGPGFKLDSKVLGIVGASLLILGIFMPIISFMGLIGLSYMQIAQLSAAFVTGYILPILGGLALFLALKGQYKPLVAIGIAALVILLIDFFRIKSAITNLPFNFPGARPGVTPDPLASQYLQTMIQISWGFFAMIAGAIILIVAGMKKDNTPLNSTDWNRNPPPPMNYS